MLTATGPSMGSLLPGSSKRVSWLVNRALRIGLTVSLHYIVNSVSGMVGWREGIERDIFLFDTFLLL